MMHKCETYIFPYPFLNTAPKLFFHTRLDLEASLLHGGLFSILFLRLPIVTKHIRFCSRLCDISMYKWCFYMTSNVSHVLHTYIMHAITVRRSPSPPVYVDHACDPYKYIFMSERISFLCFCILRFVIVKYREKFICYNMCDDLYTCRNKK